MLWHEPSGEVYDSLKKWPFIDVDDKHLWLTRSGLIRLKHAQPFLIC